MCTCICKYKTYITREENKGRAPYTCWQGVCALPYKCAKAFFTWLFLCYLFFSLNPISPFPPQRPELTPQQHGQT